MTDLTGGEAEGGSAGKRIVAILCILGLVSAIVVGGFLALFMGIIASSAGAVGSGAGCVPSSSTSTASTSWGEASSTRPTPPATTSSQPAAASSSTGWGSSSTSGAAPAAAAVPQSIEIPYGDRGTTVTLDEKQIAIATRIITIGRELGVSDLGLKIALMTALQESRLRMYANSSVPESLNYPHDAVGSDHDSVNPFQQRPSAGWGTVADLMDLDYSIKAFFGGPAGPNQGSPRGLLDITGWESMQPGEAAQAVQGSAFPDAYDNWEAAAEQLVSTLGDGISGGCTGSIDGEIQLPLRSDYNMTSGYGPRDAGVPGASTWHAAIDLQRWPDPCGDPVYAILPGKVVLSSALWLSIEHQDGYVVSYLHMYKSQRLVDVGDTVEAGQQVGVVGNVPPSGGCHLDLRINVANNTNPEVAKLILSQNDTRLPRPATLPEHQNFVNPEDFFELWGVDLCPVGSCQ